MFGQKSQIESKNLTYLEDTMNQELLAYKKSQQYETLFGDTNLSDLAKQLADHHKQQFETLNNYLQSHT